MGVITKKEAKKFGTWVQKGLSLHPQNGNARQFGDPSSGKVFDRMTSETYSKQLFPEGKRK